MEGSQQSQRSEASVPRKQRRRRKTVRALVIVGSIVAFLACFALWANRQLLETNTWADTSNRLIQDPEIQTQLSNYMVDTLYANVDVQAELQQALPPRLQPIAGPAAGAIRQLTDKLASEALTRPRVQQLWVEANRNAQRTLLNVVENGGSEPLTLNIGTIADQVGQEAGVNAAGKLPPNIANIQIASNSDLVKVNDYLNLLKTLAWVLVVATLVIFALAIYLAEGWRRECLRSVGWAFIVVGVLVLILRTVAGNVVVDQLVSNDAVKPAAHNAWTIGTDLLAASGSGLIFYGIFMLIGAWLAGPGSWARGARRAITPVLENRWVAYGALAILLLLLFAWAPTPAFSRLPTSILLIVLSIIGLEFLRHKAVKDFPEETWDGAPDRWSAGIRGRFGGGS